MHPGLVIGAAGSESKARAASAAASAAEIEGTHRPREIVRPDVCRSFSRCEAGQLSLSGQTEWNLISRESTEHERA